MIRILHVFSVLDAGGMENYVMNLYRKMDREKIQFDFLVHHQRRGFFEDEIETMGGKVYHFSVLDDFNILKYCKKLNCFFQQHREYRIVHGHLSSLAYLYLGIAHKNGIPWRIVHSHGAGFLRTIKGFAKYLLFRTAKLHANIRLSCSTEAGYYLFGNASFTVLPNCIDTDRFAYNVQVRSEMRNALGACEDFVIGHVGRFNLQKNHQYLLQIFKAFLQEVPNAKLLLLGDGELMEDIRRQATEMGVGDRIIFAGVHKECEHFYQAMDAFVLPSLFEGLPVTGIEAQYNGLPCLFSDTISREVAITREAKFIGIQERDISRWCSELMILVNKQRHKADDLITDAFNARSAAENIATMYYDLWEKNPC